jgi:hypothetical protein
MGVFPNELGNGALSRASYPHHAETGKGRRLRRWEVTTLDEKPTTIATWVTHPEVLSRREA